MVTLEEINTVFAPHVGVPFEELARKHKLQWPEDARGDKGFARRLVEHVLHLSDQSCPVPWPVKTVPVSVEKPVREPVKVAQLQHEDVYETPFATSEVARLLNGLLLLPVVKNDVGSPRTWYIRSPTFWSASPAERTQLSADYEEVRQLIRQQRVDQLSSAAPPSGQGRWLTSKTTGKDGSHRTTVKLGGTVHEVKPLSWSLRAEFVKSLLDTSAARRMRDGTLDDFLGEDE